jgi:hypothetical protein
LRPPAGSLPCDFREATRTWNGNPLSIVPGLEQLGARVVLCKSTPGLVSVVGGPSPPLYELSLQRQAISAAVRRRSTPTRTSTIGPLRPVPVATQPYSRDFAFLIHTFSRTACSRSDLPRCQMRFVDARPSSGAWPPIFLPFGFASRTESHEDCELAKKRIKVAGRL